MGIDFVGVEIFLFPQELKFFHHSEDLELDDSQMTKCENLYNSRWRTAAILNIVFGHNCAADCPISVKFLHGVGVFHRS